MVYDRESAEKGGMGKGIHERRVGEGRLRCRRRDRAWPRVGTVQGVATRGYRGMATTAEQDDQKPRRARTQQQWQKTNRVMNNGEARAQHTNTSASFSAPDGVLHMRAMGCGQNGKVALQPQIAAA